MNKTTSDYSKRQAGYQRKRRAKRKAAGLCVQCGEIRAHGVRPTTGKPYVTCEFCREKVALRNAEHQERKATADTQQGVTHGKPHPFTTTGKRYRHKQTGKVGIIVPCPGDDPIVLDVGNKTGGYDVWHRKECVEVKGKYPVEAESLYAIVPILQYLKKIYQPYKEVS